MASKTQTPAWGRALAWLLLVALLALVAFQLKNSMKGILTRGEKAPTFSLEAFDDQTINSADLAGKVVLINIWASWCKPCEQEAGFLQEAWQQYSNSGVVVFLGVDYVDTEKEALAYIEKFGITYSNGPDLGTNIFHSFRAQGVPETFVINKLGEVATVKIGPFTSLAEITETVDRLLAAQP